MFQKSWWDFTHPRSAVWQIWSSPSKVFEATHLQCTYSQHSTPETAHYSRCCTCHPWCSWSSVAVNRVPLRCLQSHQWSTYSTTINTCRTQCKLFLHLIRVQCLHFLPFNTYNNLKAPNGFSLHRRKNKAQLLVTVQSRVAETLVHIQPVYCPFCHRFLSLIIAIVLDS